MCLFKYTGKRKRQIASYVQDKMYVLCDGEVAMVEPKIVDINNASN